MNNFKFDEEGIVKCEHEGVTFRFNREAVITNAETIGSYRHRGNTYRIDRKSLYGNIFIEAMMKEVERLRLKEMSLLDSLFQTLSYLKKYTSVGDGATHAKNQLHDLILKVGTDNQKTAVRKMMSEQEGV